MKRRALVTALAAAALAGAAAVRPYEFDWANRTADDRPVLLPLVDAAGWTVSATNAVATFARADAHCLFGDAVPRLVYRGTGPNPRITLRPPAPVLVKGPVDTVSVWVYGNNVSYARDPSTPPVHIEAQFTDANGKPFSVSLYTVRHLEWFLVQRRLAPDQAARLARGGAFAGFAVTGGTNEKDRWIELTSLAVYREELKPLAFKPRPKRPNRVFPDCPPGVNTGDGELSFPNRALTVVPPAGEPAVRWRLPARAGCWDDFALVGADGVARPIARGGGVFFADVRAGSGKSAASPSGKKFGEAALSPLHAAVGESFSVTTNAVSPLDVVYAGTFTDAAGRVLSRARLRFHEEGQSLVLDLQADGGRVAEVRFGSFTEDDLPGAWLFTVPYWSYSMTGAENRPHVACFTLDGRTHFLSAFMDWTQSNASEPFCTPYLFDGSMSVHGGVRYRAKTDGARNPCYERFVWSASANFADVLPSIPNPPSPHRALTAEYEWCHCFAGDRAKDKAYWRDRRRRGLTKVFIGDHEVCMRDGNESFTFRTRTAPKKGGDEGTRDFTRYMIDTLGYLYGPYNNYTDFATVNGLWHADRMTRQPDGNLLPAWNRCYAPKPTFAVEACEWIVPELQRKFNFNSGYCDVHTCVSPWSRCDYDARVPGAGTFAGTFYAYGELLGMQRKFWTGPVYSEGGVHFMYCGLDDGNFAQDQGARLDVNPWLVDFDLLRMHPLANNFGMGYPRMFYGKGAVPKDHALYMDRFLAATIAFGHVGYFFTGNPDEEEQGYWMVQPLAARYAKANAEDIRYAAFCGKFVDTTDALLSGEYRRSQVAVRYDDGTRVVVNGSPDGEWLVLPQAAANLAVPPNGWFALSGDGQVASISAFRAGGRADACAAPESFYMDGRGTWFDSGHGATDGRLIRLFAPGGSQLAATEEIFIRHAKEVELPYAAVSVTRLDAAGAEIGPASFAVTNGRTRLVADKAAYSYRAVKPAGWTEPPAATLAQAFTLPKDWAPPAVAKPPRAFTLPPAFAAGMALRGKGEVPLDTATGANVHRATAVVGGVAKDGYYMHPPYKRGTGYTFMRWRLNLPEKPLAFHASIGKVDRSSTGDGTLYRVIVEDAAGVRHVVAEKQTCEHRWQDLVADLSPWKGQRVKFMLVSDPGPANNNYGDHSSWCDLRFDWKE